MQIKESLRDYLNFYFENEIWHHRRLPQGWCASLQIAQRAVLWTFRDSTLADFISSHGLTPKQFSLKSYRNFVQGFVDDLPIFAAKDVLNAKELHCLAIESVFMLYRN